MRTLRDLPIKQKLLVIIIVSTTAALLFSGIAHHSRGFRFIPLAGCSTTSHRWRAWWAITARPLWHSAIAVSPWRT